MSTQRKTQAPREIDDIQDRMGSLEQLDFSARKDERQGRIGDERPQAEQDHEFSDQRVREAGLSGGETLGEGEHEDGVSMDDLSPETLLDESGARSPREPGERGALDQDLSIVDGDQIGAGGGLDEAELARRDPLDGKPWGREPQGPDLDEEED
ncbi:phosphotransferase system, HPr-related protein [Pseudomonas sp. PDM14]|uniref:phosphotransferase system, HPr-related protein n=1 Tax=Pseudomonas sp. PDM14 TaxID=2769288 RepID=UPI00177D84EC|nr:phosphotransferase system, HPr-related protein [Pseudomonas sp. PDM14]MBD9485244.1 phosphotransferase system, HPr-related protein [Pseudomonas sp. PDM14]